MANGYCLPLLKHINELTSCNPAKKLQPLGITQALLAGMDGSVSSKVLNEQFDAGHTRSMSIKFRKRPLESIVADEPSACDTANTPAYGEFSPPSLMYREVSLWVPDSLIRQYCKDASAMVNLSGETDVMREVYEMLIEYGGALLRSINKANATYMATQFGDNLVTGDNLATALTFSLGSNGMQDAFVRLMTDLRENEFCNEVMMVGNGDFANIDLIRKWFSNMAADNGLNKANMLSAFPEVFYDKDTKALWGENQIGVFEKGAVAFETYNRYVGSFARKLANSEFFTMALPVDEYCCPQKYLDRLMFDVQVREIDCPTQLTVNGVETTVSNGVQIILSKYFTPFVKPTNLYETTDPLYGTNGTLRYEIQAAE